MLTAVSLLEEPRRGHKKFVVRWPSFPDPKTGKQRRYGKSFKSLHAAKLFQAEKIAEISRGENIEPVVATLAELIEQFETSRLAALSHASRVSYQQTIKQLLAYFGGSHLVRAIERRHAEAFIATRRRCDGGELAAWSLARHLIQCRAIFAAGKEWRFTQENPFRAVRGMGSSPLRMKPKSRPWQVIAPEEFKRFLAVIPDARRRAIYGLMFACGLRAGEAYNLTSANIDLKARRIYIRNRAATDTIPPFTVKADAQACVSKERCVPIPESIVPDLVAALKTAFKSGGFIALTPARFQLIQERWNLCRQGRPWGGHEHRPWQNRDMANNAVRDAKNFFSKAGIQLTAPLTLSTFRKSYAQALANAGIPPRTLAELLGHSDTRVTTEFYSRVTEETTQRVAETMNRLLTGDEKATCRSKATAR